MKSSSDACCKTDPWTYRKPSGQWEFLPPSGPLLALANSEFRTADNIPIKPLIQYFPDGIGVQASVINGNGEPSWIAWSYAPLPPSPPINDFDQWADQFSMTPGEESYAKLAWDAAKG